MRKTCITLLLSVLCLLSKAQSDPIPLEYAIGKFKITAGQDKAISARFSSLDPNKTYMVYISGSADFLGSKDNNVTLSNKRVKFAEYHLLQHYSQHRLIIKLDSKGEMNAQGKKQSSKGIQEHRMVYIHIQDYDGSNVLANNNETGLDRTVATSAAASAEKLKGIPKVVSTGTVQGGYKVDSNNNANPNTTRTDKKIVGTSMTAQIERAKEQALHNQEQLIRAAESQQVPLENSTDAGLAPASASSGTLKVNGDSPLKIFDGEGTLSVGEKLLLSDMNFRPGSHYLRPSSIPSLRKLIDVLEDNPNLQIEIRGHICCHPDYSIHPDGFDREAGNHKLSYNRAQNIKEYLEKNGIHGDRITAVGMGAKERLVYPEETDDDRVKNRRVEIVIRKI